jgi:hypothetical protein
MDSERYRNSEELGRCHLATFQFADKRFKDKKKQN